MGSVFYPNESGDLVNDSLSARGKDEKFLHKSLPLQKVESEQVVMYSSNKQGLCSQKTPETDESDRKKLMMTVNNRDSTTKHTEPASRVISINNQPCNVIFDTGASLSIISPIWLLRNESVVLVEKINRALVSPVLLDAPQKQVTSAGIYVIVN